MAAWATSSPWSIWSTYQSLEGCTWQQERSCGQSNVAGFFVYFATLDLPWGAQPSHERCKKGIGNIALARATLLCPRANIKSQNIQRIL